MNPQEKRKQTIIKKYGTWENYLEYQRKNGKDGGLISTVRPFRDIPGLARKANRKSLEVRSASPTKARKTV